MTIRRTVDEGCERHEAQERKSGTCQKNWPMSMGIPLIQMKCSCDFCVRCGHRQCSIWCGIVLVT
jgi:hypothetical protein